MDSPERRTSPPKGQRKKRIANACLQCKQKKKRCDGNVPRCLSCAERNLDCNYLGIRRRGRGKAKSYLEKLEARVAELEASIHNSTNAPVGSDYSTSAGVESTPAERTPELCDDEIDPSILPDCPKNDHSNAILPTAQPAQPAQAPGNHEQMQSALRERLFALLPEQRSFEKAKLEVNRSPFTSQVFIELPSKPHLESLLLGGLEELEYTLPLFDPSVLMRLLEEHLSEPDMSPGKRPERWAMLNAGIAVAMQTRTAKGSHSEMMDFSSHFFKNAFSMYPVLAVRGADILALEALLAMAIYMRGFSDVRTTSVLVSAAARLSLTLGLHQKSSYTVPNLSQIDQHRHVKAFWIAYLMDKDIAVRTGLASSFDDDAITLDYPGPELAITTSSIPARPEPGPNIPPPSYFFQMRCRLAVIESKVERQLRSFSPSISTSATTKPNIHQILDVVQRLENQLETWNDSLPLQIRPLKHINWPDVPAAAREPIIALHLAYYRIVCETQRFAAVHLKQEVLREAEAEINPMRLGQMKFLTITQAFAAGQIIALLQHLPWQQPGHLWYLLHYPLAAYITLVAIVLADPADSQAGHCARDMGDFARFLETVQRENTLGVQALLDLCSAFERLVLQTIATATDGRGSNPISSIENLTSGFSNALAIGRELEILSYTTSGTLSTMQLACGLMGNMPNLRSIAVKTFSELVPDAQHILAPSSSSASSGVLAPAALDPETYRFTFT
ncbi:hypothetical protein BJX64DRAFT_285007 [Aspergillus heterothallicus]